MDSENEKTPSGMTAPKEGFHVEQNATPAVEKSPKIRRKRGRPKKSDQKHVAHEGSGGEAEARDGAPRPPYNPLLGNMVLVGAFAVLVKFGGELWKPGDEELANIQLAFNAWAEEGLPEFLARHQALGALLASFGMYAGPRLMLMRMRESQAVEANLENDAGGYPRPIGIREERSAATPSS